MANNRMMVGFFVASESFFFLMLILAYVNFHGSQVDGPTAVNSLNPIVTGIFSLFLLASSFTIWLAGKSLKNKNDIIRHDFHIRSGYGMGGTDRKKYHDKPQRFRHDIFFFDGISRISRVRRTDNAFDSSCPRPVRGFQGSEIGCGGMCFDILAFC